MPRLVSTSHYAQLAGKFRTGFSIALVLSLVLSAGWLADRSAGRSAYAAADGTSAAEGNPAWIVWYSEDARLYRLAAGAPYGDLYRFLRQSLESDLDRLDLLARGHIEAEMDPVFAALMPRLPPFLDNLFSFDTSMALLWVGLEAAGNVPRPIVTAEALDQVRQRLADQVAERFRNEVLMSSASLHALRVAMEHAFNNLRQDVLQNCTRYDRAFRWFVLNTSGTVETLESDGVWRSDSSWEPNIATFMSLCQGLRRAEMGAGSALEASLGIAFNNAEARMREQALQRSDPLAETAVAVAGSTANVSEHLGYLGIPANWAHPPSLLVGYVSSAWRLGRGAAAGLGAEPERQALTTTLNQALEGLRADVQHQLRQVGREFLAAELERISLGLAARSEGVWSSSP